MNLRRIDLNLLVIFDALMTERNVTRAARRVGLSQPAFSNALTRLRERLKDELFVRSPQGMRPTPRAVELASEVHDALATIESALDPVAFDPKTARRTFTIDTSDYVVTSCFSAIMSHLAREAPGIDLRLLPAGGRIYERLDAREVDFGIGAYGEVPERFGTVVLDEDEFVVIMRPDHPLARGRLTLERYAAAKHLLVTLRGDARGFVDDILAEHGLTRRIALTVNQFSVAPGIVAESDLVTALPQRIADRYAPLFKLTVRPFPQAAPFVFRAIQLIWHEHFAAHPAHLWFRRALEEVICNCKGSAAQPCRRTAAR